MIRLSALRRECAVMVMLYMAVACKSDTTSDPPDDTIDKVIVTPATRALSPGDTMHLVAAAYNKSGTVLTEAAVWSTTNADVVEVQPSGLIRANRSGTAMVLATIGGKTGFATINVGSLKFQEVIAGGGSCGMTESGNVYCWGRNSIGLLGTSPIVESSKPVRVPVSSAVKELTVGSNHVCALANSGEVICWGGNRFGELGAGPGGEVCDAGPPQWLCRRSPAPTSGSVKFNAIEGRGLHSCALSETGQAFCWGMNPSGQLGYASGELCHWDYATPCSTIPREVSGAHSFAAVRVGGSASCGIKTDRTVWCWGHNGAGNLGIIGADTIRVPTRLDNAPPLVDLSLSVDGSHSCGITTDGTAYCWGDNSRGQLGTGDRLASPTPRLVQTSEKFLSITAGYLHTCGVTVNGAILCWGITWYGRMGNGQPGSASEGINIPSPAATTALFKSVSAGFSHTCAVSVSGDVYCWGQANAGQAGSPPTATCTNNMPCILVPTKIQDP
jgi:hypothetical protein